MATGSNGGDHESRISDLEGLMRLLINDTLEHRDDNRREHKELLTAQVLLTDEVRKLTANVEAQRANIEALRASQQHDRERLDTLIVMVDAPIRRDQES